MCGIVGLFLKDRALEPRLGALLSDMLVTMTDRGPDSAGIAVYGAPRPGRARITVQSSAPDTDFPALAEALARFDAEVATKSTHAVISLDAPRLAEARAAAEAVGAIRVMSAGEAVEIFKEVGLPAQVVDRFGIRAMAGSHGVGHTRMATESAVTTLGAHPFSTDEDQCLVSPGWPGQYWGGGCSVVVTARAVLSAAAFDTHTADFLVGSDGLGSKMRGVLNPNEARAWEGAQAVPSTSAQHRTKNSSAPALLPCSPMATRPARLLNRLPIKYLFVEVECETEEGRQKHDNGK